MAVSIDNIKTARGSSGEQLLSQAKRAKHELTTLRSQFSTVFGAPDREVKGMDEIEELLGKVEESPLYLQLASQQAMECQRQLLAFGVELSKLHKESLAAAMSLDPQCEYNSAEVMAKLADTLQERHKKYSDKHSL